MQDAAEDERNDGGPGFDGGRQPTIVVVVVVIVVIDIVVSHAVGSTK